MRTAVVVSGDARYAESNYVSEYLITPTNADAFCFFWDRYEPILNVDPSRAIELIRPVGYEVRQQVMFDLDWSPELDWTFRTTNDTHTHERIVRWKFQQYSSMFYAMQQADQIRQKHEKENGFVYDCVIRCRTDTTYGHIYDWANSETKQWRHGLRRFWTCTKITW